MEKMLNRLADSLARAIGGRACRAATATMLSAALAASPVQAGVKFGVMSDAHFNPSTTGRGVDAGHYRAMFQYFKDQGIAALILPGDLGASDDNGTQTKTVATSLAQAFAGSGIQILYVRGNHPSGDSSHVSAVHQTFGMDTACTIASGGRK